MKEITREEFESLFYSYGETGDSIFDKYEEITLSQKSDLKEAWGEFEQNGIKGEELRDLLTMYFKFFNNDRFFTINYHEVDLDGFAHEKGTLCYDEKSLTTTFENVLGFETKTEAEEYVLNHNNKWSFGYLTVNC